MIYDNTWSYEIERWNSLEHEHPRSKILEVIWSPTPRQHHGSLWVAGLKSIEVSGVGEGGNHSKSSAAPWQRKAQAKRSWGHGHLNSAQAAQGLTRPSMILKLFKSIASNLSTVVKPPRSMEKSWWDSKSWAFIHLCSEPSKVWASGRDDCLPLQAPPPEEDYDGACGVIVSASEDALGCWTVEATRKGVTCPSGNGDGGVFVPNFHSSIAS